jgi:uncharacterized membrane protein YhaH (DUF805 family)
LVLSDWPWSSRAPWWAGLAIIIAAIAAMAVGAASPIVRRLHDLGLSGYHAIWIGAAELASTVLSFGPNHIVMLGLPLTAIQRRLLFYPGNAAPNRFGSWGQAGRAAKNRRLGRTLGRTEATGARPPPIPRYCFGISRSLDSVGMSRWLNISRQVRSST